MLPRLRLALKLLGLAVVLFVGCVAAEGLRGHFALAGRMRALERQGEVLDYRKLIPPRPVAGSNAFPALLQLTNIFPAVSNVSRISFPSVLMLTNGRAMASWQVEDWLNESGKTNSWADLESDLPALRVFATRLHEALQRPGFDMGFNYEAGFVKFEPVPLVPVKYTARWLTAAVTDAIRRERRAEAVMALGDLIRLVELQSNEALIISQLIRLSCAEMAIKSTWELIQSGQATPEQLATLQTAWQRMDLTSDMIRAYEMERALSLDFYEQLRQSPAARAEQVTQWAKIDDMGLFPDLVPNPSRWMEYVHLPLWSVAWVEQDSLRALERWQTLIEAGRVGRDQSWNQAKDRIPPADESGGSSFVFWAADQPKLGAYDRARFLFSSQVFMLNGKEVQRALRFDTLRQMAVTALALKRHELRPGRPAADLQALVPEFLTAVPTDRMDGQPLRYRLLPGNRFLLYSVGDDGQDNGGDVSRGPDKAPTAPFWNRRDMVWPELASPEEVRNYWNTQKEAASRRRAPK